MKQEMAGKLLRALTDVDERYIEEAMELRNRESRRATGGWNLVKCAAAAAVCLVMIWGVRALWLRLPVSSDSSEMTQVCNPYQEVSSLKEAVSIVGFDMKLPDAEEPYANVSYLVISGEMIEVFYGTQEQENVGYYIRKSKGNEDISGDFTDYAETKQVFIHNSEVTLKGQDGKWSLATWAQGGYSYAIGAQDDPMTERELSHLIEETN